MNSDCLLLPLSQGLDRVRLEGWRHQFFDLGEGEEQGFHRSADPRGEWVDTAEPTMRGDGRRTSVWYRAEFSHPGWAERTLLRFDGAFMAANVWLNGKLLGSHYGYPGPFGFDISSYLNVHNVVAVCVEATENGSFLPPALGGMIDAEGPWWPLGLVGRSWLERLGSVALESLEAEWRISAGTAEARIRTTLRNLDGRDMPVTIGWALNPPEAEEGSATVVGPPPAPVRWRRTALIPGRQSIEMETTVAVDRPRLWWPWTLGKQEMYGLVANVECGDRRSTSALRMLGIREIHLEPAAGGLTWVVNGQRHFPRGAVLPPLPPGSEGDPIAAWRLAGLDLALCRGQVPAERTAERADQAGVMLVIDPPAAEPGRGDEGPQPAHLREAIRLVASHPSAAVLLQRGTVDSFEALPATTAVEEPYTVTAADRTQVEAVRRAKFHAATALVLETLPDLLEADGPLAATVALLEWSDLPDGDGVVLRFFVVNEEAAAAGPALVRWSVRSTGTGWRGRREKRGEIAVYVPAPNQPAAIYEAVTTLPRGSGSLLADVTLERDGAVLSELDYLLSEG